MFCYPNGAACVRINGLDISKFHAKIPTDYSISGALIDLDTWQGQGRSTMQLLAQRFSACTIVLPVDFYGASKPDTVAAQVAFNRAVSGEFDLDLSDGYIYHCVTTETGGTAWISDEFCTVDYTFLAVRQKPLVSTKKRTVNNDSTVPRCDCRITVPNFVFASGAGTIRISLQDAAGATYLSYTFRAGSGAYTGGAMVLDGIAKKLSYNGSTIPSDVTWADYPYLVPGENTVSITVGGTDRPDLEALVEFYPAFI